MELAIDWISLPGLASHPWAYPAFEVVHIIGIALLVGNLALIELRVMGLGRALPMLPLGALALRLSLAGFALAAGSGLLMFSARPAELLANQAFLFKVGVLALCGVNAALFHVRGGLRRIDTVAKLQTALSLGLWIAVIICGRWIAYR